MYDIIILFKNGEILCLTELDDFRLNEHLRCYIAEAKKWKNVF